MHTAGCYNARQTARCISVSSVDSRSVDLNAVDFAWCALSWPREFTYTHTHQAATFLSLSPKSTGANAGGRKVHSTVDLGIENRLNELYAMS